MSRTDTELSQEVKEKIDYIFENGKKEMVYRLTKERAKTEYHKGHGNYVFITSIEVDAPSKLVSEYCKNKGYIGSRVNLAIPDDKKPRGRKPKEKNPGRKKYTREITKSLPNNKPSDYLICTNISIEDIGHDMVQAQLDIYGQEPISILTTKATLNIRY